MPQDPDPAVYKSAHWSIEYQTKFSSKYILRDKMKVLFSLFAVSCMAIDNMLLMMMMQQQTISNPNQGNQMNMMLPFLLMEDSDSTTSDNSNMLMMMMMQGGDMGNMNAMLPMLMLSDDTLDFKSLFLMTNMMNQGMIYTFLLFLHR